MEETGKPSSSTKSKARKFDQDEGKRGGIRRRTTPSRERKTTATIMSCYDAVRGLDERNTDSLESLLNSYIGDDDVKHERITCRKPINHEMVENVFMECLNLSKNSNCPKSISQIILQYFTHVVFNRIKYNYNKQLSRNHEECRKYQDLNELYFKELNTCPISLHLNEFVTEEPENVSSLSRESFATVNSDSDTDKPNTGQEGSASRMDAENADVSNTISEQTFRDAFLCNLPNAPPFILKMKKTSIDLLTEDVTVCSEVSLDELKPIERTNSASSLPGCGFSVKMPNDANSYSFPSFENQAFDEFVTKSISLLRRKQQHAYMSSPTICMTGLTGMSSNPFNEDEVDAKELGRGSRNAFNTADILYKRKSYHFHSKIPRMLHPGKCKVHAKMKSVQMSSGGRSGCAANRGQSTSSKGCSPACPFKSDSSQKTSVKVTVSTACPSLTDSCGNKTAQTPTSQSSMGDCMKGIKSDPGCYCGNPPVETKPCPVRLQEDCACVEEEEPEPEEEEALCYCPPGEQPLLMKKSNIECDCANRRRCEDETLIEPPKEKPNVFWALTKVSLLKDGTKNFEIIDVSPVPPGYYLMPDVNNLVLVGPQPKPAKPAPSKNCCCK